MNIAGEHVAVKREHLVYMLRMQKLRQANGMEQKTIQRRNCLGDTAAPKDIVTTENGQPRPTIGIVEYEWEYFKAAFAE